MPEQKRRPLGDGAVLLGGEQCSPTETLHTRQLKTPRDPALAKERRLKLRSGLTVTFAPYNCCEHVGGPGL